MLGAIGLYGVLSYAVTLRTREIGVRMALGAGPRPVKRGILANAAAITATGLVIGALGAAGLTRFLGGLLYETKPLDAPTFAGDVRTAVRGGCGRRVSAGPQSGLGKPARSDANGIRLGQLPTPNFQLPRSSGVDVAHASRNTRAGSMRAARRAGSQAATALTAQRKSAAPMNVSGSRASRSYSSVVTYRDAQ